MIQALIDARPLTDAGSYRGMGTYVRNLLRHLPQEAIGVNALVLAGTALPDGVQPVVIQRRAPGRLAALEHEWRLPFDVNRAGADVFHSTGLEAPRRVRVPWVATIYDVIPLVWDDPSYATARRRWLKAASRYRRARAVICPSRHSADEVITRLGIDPGRVHAVPLGLDPAFAPAPEGNHREDDTPYLVHVGEYDPRKGFAEAFEVIGALADAGFPHRLKMAGRLAPWVEPEVRALLARSPHPERVDLLGFVDDLVALYRGASAAIVTSRYEGFGFPALEAMGCGVPTIAFANSSITEVVGDGGCVVPDGEVEAFAVEVANVLRSPERAADVAARGAVRARAFSWERTAANHAEIYRTVASGADSGQRA